MAFGGALVAEWRQIAKIWRGLTCVAGAVPLRKEPWGLRFMSVIARSARSTGARR